MDFEEYVVEELKKLNTKVDDLMLFMAVKKSEDSKTSKYTAMIIGGIVSLVVSIVVFLIEKKL